MIERKISDNEDVSKKVKLTSENQRGNELDRLEFTITRLDHYFDSVNNKATVYLAINTFLTGGIISILSQISFIAKNELPFILIGSLILLFGLCSLTLLAITSVPFFSGKIESLHYFGSISSCNSKAFHKASKRSTEKSNIKDLREQVYQLSCGLKSKFEKLRIVGFLLIGQFILLLPFFYLLIFKFYNNGNI